MNLQFENQGTNTYLVYEIKENDEIDTLSLGMLTNNKIPSLAPVMFTQMDNTKYIKYNVSAKVPVQQLFSRAVSKKNLLGVFNGIVNAMMSAEEYMIDVNTILVDLNYMFTDVTTCETILISLPIDSVAKTSALSDLGTLFKNIVFSTQFDQTENCDYVAKLISYLNSTPSFTLENFKKVLDSLDGTNTAIAQKSPAQAVPTQATTMQAAQLQPQQAAPIQKATQISNVQTTQTVAEKSKNQQIVVPTATATVAQQSDSNEKSMSMFYLLNHYNKENAQLYKEQKQRKKEQAAQKKQTEMMVAENKGKSVPTAPNMGFAIPGQSNAPQSATIPMPSVRPIQQAPAPQPQPVQPMSPVQSAPVQMPTIAKSVDVQPQLQSANFGETTVLNASNNIGETTVLNMTQINAQPRPCLIRMKNNEKIWIEKPVFRIGKEKSYVDYFIGDNTAISRSHANIISRDGEYFVVDTNSTNHTYVNGTMIQSGVETKIDSGTMIKLSNEDFEFKIL